MDKKKKIKELRELTGMKRTAFCKYFNIPYRTVTDWERGERQAPDYVLRLLEYYIRMEKLDSGNMEDVMKSIAENGKERGRIDEEKC